MSMQARWGVSDAWMRAANQYFDPPDPTPVCDYCDEPWEDGGEGEDWNGETGCHVSCEERNAEDEEMDDGS